MQLKAKQVSDAKPKEKPYKLSDGGGLFLTDLSSIFDFAVARGLTPTNPISGLRGLVAIPDSESKAKLSPTQIREFFTKLTG